MAGQGPFSAYTDIPTVQASAPPIPITPALVGGNTRLSADAAAAATSLQVLSSAGFAAGTMVWILDGPNSEIVFTDGATPAPDNTHVALQSPGTQFAHSALASVSSAGTNGSLAQLILDASGWMESFCLQGTLQNRSLFGQSRTDRLRMPTTRAMINPYGTLVVRPRSFPVQSVTSLSIEYAPGSSIALDAAQVELDSAGQEFRVPFLRPPAGARAAPYLDYGPVGRQDEAWCVVTYVGGVTWPNLPWDIQRAANFAVYEFMGYQQNPTGAAMIRQGDTMIVQRLKGSSGKESSIDGLYLSQAKSLLEPYRAQFI